jgi:hypothetical protein
MKRVSYKHEGRWMWIDERIGPTTARKFLSGKVPNLSYDLEGQRPCIFTEGEQIVIEPHRFWIVISRIRAKAGRWNVEYILADHRPNLMGKKTGYTHNPRRAMRADYTDPGGDRHDELEAVTDVARSLEQERTEMENRKTRATLERLKSERAAHKRRLMKTNSEISRRLIPRLIAELDREIARIEVPAVDCAA